MKGAISEVLQKSTFYNSNDKLLPLTPEKFKFFMTQAENMMNSGLRGNLMFRLLRAVIY